MPERRQELRTIHIDGRAVTFEKLGPKKRDHKQRYAAVVAFVDANLVGDDWEGVLRLWNAEQDRLDRPRWRYSRKATFLDAYKKGGGEHRPEPHKPEPVTVVSKFDRLNKDPRWVSDQIVDERRRELELLFAGRRVGFMDGEPRFLDEYSADELVEIAEMLRNLLEAVTHEHRSWILSARPRLLNMAAERRREAA